MKTTKVNITQECSCGELEHGEEDAPDDASLPAAGLADGLGDELVLAEGFDADLPWGQTSFCLAPIATTKIQATSYSWLIHLLKAGLPGVIFADTRTNHKYIFTVYV